MTKFAVMQSLEDLMKFKKKKRKKKQWQCKHKNPPQNQLWLGKQMTSRGGTLLTLTQFFERVENKKMDGWIIKQKYIEQWDRKTKSVD